MTVAKATAPFLVTITPQSGKKVVIAATDLWPEDDADEVKAREEWRKTQNLGPSIFPEEVRHWVNIRGKPVEGDPKSLVEPELRLSTPVGDDPRRMRLDVWDTTYDQNGLPICAIRLHALPTVPAQRSA